jgi:CubicO group peptidase (beta-lactamase class C family)
MKLVQEKKIELDKPVIGYLKRWRFDGADDRRNAVTVRHLLSHTAGIDDPSGYTGFASGEPVRTLEEYLSGARLTREPGTEFVYGNSASAILQLLIEDVTGQRFTDYMAENVLRPLGMSNSTFDFDVAKGSLAPAFDASVNLREPRRHSIPAAVALYTSGRDLGRFARALGGSNPVLNEDTLQMMVRPVPPSGGTWGLGLNLFTENESGGHVIGHDGGAQPSWGAMVRLNPATRNGMAATISGGRGAVNMLSHDWVYWETGKLTPEARRQLAYTRAQPAAVVIGVGALLICVITFIRRRARRTSLSKR